MQRSLRPRRGSGRSVSGNGAGAAVYWAAWLPISHLQLADGPGRGAPRRLAARPCFGLPCCPVQLLQDIVAPWATRLHGRPGAGVSWHAAAGAPAGGGPGLPARFLPRCLLPGAGGPLVLRSPLPQRGAASLSFSPWWPWEQQMLVSRGRMSELCQAEERPRARGRAEQAAGGPVRAGGRRARRRTCAGGLGWRDVRR